MLRKKAVPILEYDSSRKTFLNPRPPKPSSSMPKRCVVCILPDVIAAFKRRGQLTLIGNLNSCIGFHPIYRLIAKKCPPIAVFHPGVGASLAGALFDELIALGVEKAVLCGWAGVLDVNIPVGGIVVPVSAIRDEGTSYHYLPPGREVRVPYKALVAINEILRARRLPYVLGKTWTTDAFYRETPRKVCLRKSEGCLAVEMEAAALLAVASFRKILLCAIFAAGDYVGTDRWDGRGWMSSSIRREYGQKLFCTAVEICKAL